MLLLSMVLRGRGELADPVRQLLLDSPSFERGLLSMVDSWQDVLHCSDEVRTLLGTTPARFNGNLLVCGTCVSNGMQPGWHLPGFETDLSPG
jgi:hypothetical protein